MKLSLILLFLSAVTSLQAAFNTQWINQLIELNPGVIDTVTYISSNGYGPKTLRSYMIHYHQPLQHDHPELGDLPLRAVLTIHHQEDFLNAMTQVNIGGYSLSWYITTYPTYYADYYFGCSGGELAGRYSGNFLMPEHRYFGESVPEAPWSTLGYCEAKEATADFHALLEAMKKVFHGKWAISGVSKGGTTTAIQHAFYPNDADCFVPYSGPFLGHEYDTRMHEYWLTEAWTPEMREPFFDIQKKVLHRPNVYRLFRKYFGWDDPSYDEWDSLLRAYFIDYIGMFDCDAHAYKSRDEVNEIISGNASFLASHGVEDYTDEMLLYLVVNCKPDFDEAYDSWYKENFEQSEGKRQATLRDQKHTLEFRLPMPVFGIPESDWDEGGTGYWYQAAHELGYFDLKWDLYYDTQAEADSVNAMWHTWCVNVFDLTDDTYDEVEFDYSLMERVRTNTASSNRAMLYIYGSDDIWTGARMDADCINDDNVRQYVLPAQNHGVSISAVTDAELREELWAFTDSIFRPQEQAIRSVQADRHQRSTYYDMWGRPLGNRPLRNVMVVK